MTKRTELPFTKMEGLGNDFIVVDEFTKPVSWGNRLSSGLAQKLCDRRFGIGADQILWLKKPLTPEVGVQVRMEILNADGSIAEMCGNGIRAVALYLNRHSEVSQNQYSIETLAGRMDVQLVQDEVLVNMGPPRLGKGALSKQGEEIEVDGKIFRFYEVSMGNPHAVIFVDESPTESFTQKWGSLLEIHPRFPKRTNVEFVFVSGSQKAQVRVWERGAGLTLACGTGACAVAVACYLTGKADSTLPLDIFLPGGKLQLSWNKGDSGVMMQGPAREVFQGVYFLD